MMTSSLRNALAFMLVLAPIAYSADKQPPAGRSDDSIQQIRMDVDAKIIRSLGQTIDIGAPLFNKGGHVECYNLYRGALIAVSPLLESRPELLKSIQQKMDKAEAGGAITEKAFALRSALDEVRSTLHKDQPKVVAKPLWERLGGEPAVKKVIHEFVLAAAPDPKVNFTRNNKFSLDAAGVAKLEGFLVDFVSSVTGGPLKYTGRSMMESHAGMNITEDEFNTLAGHLAETLKKNMVPEKETKELLDLVGSTKKDIVGK